MSTNNDLLRFRFLETVYDTVQGDTSADTNVSDVAAAIGLSKEAADRVEQYLVEEGLLKRVAFQGVIALTHRGVKEIEQARREPAKPTMHFPPINVIHIGQMTGSQIQQGTAESVQQISQSMTPDQIAAVSKWLDALRAAELGVAADVQAEVDAQLATIEAQMKSSRPRFSIVRAAGQELLDILKAASTAEAVDLIKRLPDIFR